MGANESKKQQPGYQVATITAVDERYELSSWSASRRVRVCAFHSWWMGVTSIFLHTKYLYGCRRDYEKVGFSFQNSLTPKNFLILGQIENGSLVNSGQNWTQESEKHVKKARKTQKYHCKTLSTPVDRSDFLALLSRERVGCGSQWTGPLAYWKLSIIATAPAFKYRYKYELHTSFSTRIPYW